MNSKEMECSRSDISRLQSICYSEKIDKIEVFESKWVGETVTFIRDPDGYRLYRVIPEADYKYSQGCGGGERDDFFITMPARKDYLLGYWKPLEDENILNNRLTSRLEARSRTLKRAIKREILRKKRQKVKNRINFLKNFFVGGMSFGILLILFSIAPVLTTCLIVIVIVFPILFISLKNKYY